MAEPAFHDLARLWHSAPAAPAEDLAARARALRRQGMARAAAEMLLTLGLMTALALELARAADLPELILVSALAVGAGCAQLRLVLLRRRLWRSIGHSPSAYWGAVAAKARLGLRIARVTYLGGPPAIAAGAVLARAAGDADWPSPRSLTFLCLAMLTALALGLREARRERAELRRAEQVLRDVAP